MRSLALTRASWLRLVRDRTTLFFIVLLPVLVILLVGATVSGFDDFRVGVVDESSGSLGARLAADLDASLALRTKDFSARESVRTALRRGELDAAVVLPGELDERLRAGETASVIVYAEQSNTAQQAALSAIRSVVADAATRVQAADFATEQVGGTFADNLALAGQATARAAPITVDVRTVDAESNFLPVGYNYSAPTMLVLFVFINSLAAGAAMIQSRRLGIYERMLAGPVSPRAIVLGEATMYLGLAVLQSVLIVVVGLVAFGVDWGDPVAAAALVGVWALVGTGAGMLSGTLFRTEEQATAIGPPVGIALGMLGGCMWPLEIVPPVMQTIGHLTPHAWAVDAWVELLSRGGGLTDVAGTLGILAAFAVGLLALATFRLRRRLSA